MSETPTPQINKKKRADGGGFGGDRMWNGGDEAVVIKVEHK